MYAAAGGASIANRRKQKRLQQKGSTTATPQLSKLKVGAGAGGALHHQHQHHHHQHQHSHQHASSKYARASQNVVPAPPAPSSSSHAFHHSRRRPEQLAPVSPIPLFPISPPPLSIESSPAPTAKTKFPFPPSSILDLRVVPSTSELQVGEKPLSLSVCLSYKFHRQIQFSKPEIRSLLSYIKQSGAQHSLRAND